jgi:hypothetical protein
LSSSIEGVGGGRGKAKSERWKAEAGIFDSLSLIEIKGADVGDSGIGVEGRIWVTGVDARRSVLQVIITINYIHKFRVEEDDMINVTEVTIGICGIY